MTPSTMLHVPLATATTQQCLFCTAVAWDGSVAGAGQALLAALGHAQGGRMGAVDMALIMAPLQLAAAACRAVQAEAQGSMRTRTVSTQVISNLSPSNNIQASLTTFGLSATTKRLLVFAIGTDAQEFKLAVDRLFKDTPLEDPRQAIPMSRDLDLIRKVYKLKDVSDVDDLLACVVGIISTKNL